jgi:hypothetical protein
LIQNKKKQKLDGSQNNPLLIILYIDTPFLKSAGRTSNRIEARYRSARTVEGLKLGEIDELGEET